MKTKTQTDKATEFLKLHQGPKILVLANVWDVVSARLVERAGFPALATSSAAVANSLGYADGQRIPREEMLAAVKRIAAKVSVPVSADLEAGYGTSRQAIVETARGLVEAGAVGLNFEDGTGNAEAPLFEPAAQEEKIRWLRAASEEMGIHFVINARTDVFLEQVGEPAGRFQHAVTRLNAYRRAGADCLFAPGVDDAATIGKLAKALDGPLNVLAGPKTPPLAELEAWGVARVSFGSWAMRGTMSAFDRFLTELRDRGTFASLQADITYAEMNKLLE
jgi:2-methylisocitrate lyase-like PEP mutase family enzyme